MQKQKQKINSIRIKKRKAFFDATLRVPRYASRNARGYSLAETLIYLALFVILSVVVINALLTIVKLFPAIRSNKDLLDSGESAMERMTREIREATSVDSANSTLGTSPGVLQLNTTDAAGAAKIVKFTTANSVLQIYENGTLSGNLIGGNTQVTNLVFTQITTAKSKAVKISLTLQDTRNTKHPSQSFYDTIIMRGSYGVGL